MDGRELAPFVLGSVRVTTIRFWHSHLCRTVWSPSRQVSTEVYHDRCLVKIITGLLCMTCMHILSPELTFVWMLCLLIPFEAFLHGARSLVWINHIIRLFGSSIAWQLLPACCNMWPKHHHDICFRNAYLYHLRSMCLVETGRVFSKRFSTATPWRLMSHSAYCLFPWTVGENS